MEQARMNMESDARKAADLVRKNGGAYCKFLSANDSGENGSHQAGILVSNRAMSLFVSEEEKTASDIVKKTVRIRWPDGLVTDSRYTYYHSKGEGRITGFGRGFKFRNPEMTGSLFIITCNDDGTYETFFLNNGDDIEEFLSDLSISATQDELLRLLDLNQLSVTGDEKIRKTIDQFISGLDTDFPSTKEMARAARMIENEVRNHIQDIVRNPDRKILSWTDVEYELFRALEQDRYQNFLNNGFKDIDEFVEVAKAVLNRRKSRAGKSLEHHLAEIFSENQLYFEEQVVTEGNKKPDFIFPSGKAYHDGEFPAEGLISLASKTTCKDRWRQVINEADRLKGRTKYLFTLQQGISENQMKEMEAEQVVLVVPKDYIDTYPKAVRKSILTLEQFIRLVKSVETEYGYSHS